MEEQKQNEIERRARVSRLNEIGRRFLEIAQTNTAEPGETDGLFAEQEELLDELQTLIKSAFRISDIIASNSDFYFLLGDRSSDLKKMLSRNGG